MNKDYKNGQRDMFNRIYDVLDQPELDYLNTENNMLLVMTRLLKELNDIRDELDDKTS